MTESISLDRMSEEKKAKFKDKLHKGDVIRCHKFVILSHTDYWGDLTNVNEISIDDQMDRDVFLAIIEWMYTFKFCRKWGVLFLLRLLETSELFKLLDLVDVCSICLIEEIQMDNCITIYEAGLRTNALYLQTTVSDFIALHWHDLSPSLFTDVALDVMIDLVKTHSTKVLPTLINIKRRDGVKRFLEDGGCSELNVEDECGLFPLDIAFEQDDLEIAHLLHEFGADLNATNVEGKCLLAKAVARGNFAVLSFLVENGANVNYISQPTKRTLLHDLSLSTDKSDMNGWVKNHLKLFDVNAVDYEGRTPLFYAIEKQNGPMLDLMLSHDAIKVDASLLELALFTLNDVGVAEKLISHGARMEFADEQGNTVFHRAILHEKWNLVNFLVKHARNVNERNNDGRTPLHLLLNRLSVKPSTTQSIELDVLKLLLKSGADPNLVDEFSGQTSLNYASRLPVFILKIILELCKGVDFNVKDREGCSPLWNSLKTGVFDTSLILVDGGADVNEGAATGDALLLRALDEKRDDIFHFLISNDANINVKSPEGLSCLMIAVKRGLTSIVDTLCKLGASMNSPDPVTNDVLLWTALKNNDYGTAQVLVSHGCDLEAPTVVEGVERTLLIRAIEEGDVKLALFLIKSGCDVNARSNGEVVLECPLHLSIKNGLPELVGALLSNLKCKVDYQDINGNTAAHLAVMNEDKDALDVLLAHPDQSALLIRNKKGQTPLSIAMDHKNNKYAEAICKRLPYAALQVNAEGENLLHVAIRDDDLEAVLFLLGLQIDVNIPTENNLRLSPLHLSARYSSGLIMRNLILAGATLDAVDTSGKTALHEAAIFDRPDHISILLENGADPNIVNNEGNNALHLAILESSFNSVQTLLLESSVDPLAVNKLNRNIIHLCANISGLCAAEMFQTIIEIIPNYPLESGDIHGNTAFLLAFVNGNGDLCRLMLKYGVCLSARNKKGESVFHIQSPASNLLENLLVLLDREPKWSEGDSCSDCESKFTLTMRKHHCRHCGRLVCGKCSELQMPILKYNLSKNVRVCQVCYAVLTTGISSKPKCAAYPLEGPD
ncbi:unnamed protein product [Bursaphelenchus xylophilus]|uniref:(pine wood nematode) hypothetical protein n=1 Tax=Bursaphelenchus xylophilus TaxID=6326 RepID=A0A1I7S7B3_BURXY|nr:unnamed protein product [Bursaphelenchus xylophilus]CAG9084857.1 unnamed protein product [Bursaphelenchus xylophilus]